MYDFFWNKIWNLNLRIFKKFVFGEECAEIKVGRFMRQNLKFVSSKVI